MAKKKSTVKKAAKSTVSKKTEKDFKLEVFGSSKEYKSKIIINDNFIRKYDEIYDYYDNFKKNKTLI